MIGKYLYASCSAEEYGRIVGMGKDGNGFPTIDIEIFHPNDLIDCHEDGDIPGSEHGLTWLDVPQGTKLILRDVLYRMSTTPGYPDNIICNTPGNGCFRCTKLFTLYDDTLDERISRDIAKSAGQIQ